MPHDGSRLPPPWAPWLAPLLWFSLFFYLLAAASPLHGQTPSARLASIERELNYSLATCARLSDGLRAQSARVASLSADLDELKASLPIYVQKLADLESELRASRALSQDLQAEISRLRGSLQTFSERLAGLSQTFDRYREAKEREVKALSRQVTGWKVIAGILGAVAVGAGVWAAVK